MATQLITPNTRGNQDQTVTREIEGVTVEFMVEQRNHGFAKNDGAWIVTQLQELVWRTGVLHERRPAKFLGVADTVEAAEALIQGATLQPAWDQDRMVR